MTNLDPVQVSDNINHPVDMRAEYRDKISGFIGVVSSIAYSMYDRVAVALTQKSDKPNKQADTYVFAIQDLESVNGSRIKRSVLPEHEIDWSAEYTDDMTGFTGIATHISYSANKCVQVRLATGDEDNKPVDSWSDIQNLVPVDEENTKPIVSTSNTAPGAAIPARNSDMRDHARGSNNPSY